MADFVFNIAKGSVAGYYDRVKSNVVATSALVIVALLASGAGGAIQSDATLQDYDDLATLLVSTNNDEAANSGYARKVLDDTVITATLAASVDDTNNWVLLKLPDQTWTAVATSAGGAWGKLLVCYDDNTGSGTDANLIPLTAHDFSVTPDGSDIVAQIATNGFFKAA